MTKIILKNSLGTLCLFGGGNNKVRMTAIKGLEFVPKSYKTIKFSGCDGLETVEDVHSPRTVSGSGDIFISSPKELNVLYNAFAQKGEMTVIKNQNKYKTSYKPISFEITGKYPKCFTFVFQIVCDQPCFLSFEPKREDVFSRQDMVREGFVLPAVFTKRISSIKLMNKGHKKAEPVIRVKNNIKEGEAFKVKIINHTTGQSLALQNILPGTESIVIDINNRKVTNENGDNLESLLTADSYLSDFYIDTGINEIEFCSEKDGLMAEIEFYPLFLGV